MRLLVKAHDQKEGAALSAYLTKQGFENKIESVSNTDWGSSEYGATSYTIWVVDEDHFDEAKAIAEEFLHNPADTKYAVVHEPESPLVSAKIFTSSKKTKTRQALKKDPLGVVTLFILILCSVLLFFGGSSRPNLQELPSAKIPLIPLVMPPVYKNLMFDYPHAYEIIDKISSAYGAESLQKPETLPVEGKVLLNKFENTPYWQGVYDILMSKHQNPDTTVSWDTPLFEKERQGQIWRLFTPCLLHADILHLLFNMIWLSVLGRQIEHRLGTFRYVGFLLIIGIFSNTAQYFMSGASFLGFSGILTGMLAFVWVRRRKAAWEGYQLQPGTIGFIAFFIFLMFAIQVGTFIAQYFFDFQFSPGIANTAHLTGALMGYVLGKLNYFSWKPA